MFTDTEHFSEHFQNIFPIYPHLMSGLPPILCEIFIHRSLSEYEDMVTCATFRSLGSLAVPSKQNLYLNLISVVEMS